MVVEFSEFKDICDNSLMIWGKVVLDESVIVDILTQNTDLKDFTTNLS